MTSYERGPDDSFGGINEPSYNAISYTWGRFQLENGPKIPLKGVTWRIPSIDPRHFSVAEFQTAINHAASDSGYLWLDVACIDQEDPDVKLEEINKQASIFQRANSVYAWMTPWPTQDMLKALHALETFAIPGHEEIGDGGYRVKIDVPSPASVDIQLLHSAVADITAQGWFTSLWTLQEGYLCSPWIMSRSCDEFTLSYFQDGFETGLERRGSLSWIIHKCSDIWRALQSDAAPVPQSVCAMIIDSGILSLSSRNKTVLYRAATKRRWTLPQDAVYGIMQVYGIQMPERSDVNRLLVDFGFILHSESVLECQLFIHEEPVLPSDAWRMSRRTYVPLVFTLLLGPGTAPASITADSRRRPCFKGTAFKLEDLSSFWKDVQASRRGSHKMSYHPHIYLDATEASELACIQLNDEHADPEAEGYNGYFEDRCTKKVGYTDLANALPCSLNRYLVLYLGTVAVTGGEYLASPREFYWEASYHIGLLVKQSAAGRDQPWFRVGFCSSLASSKRRSSTTGEVEGQLDDIPLPRPRHMGFECRIG